MGRIDIPSNDPHEAYTGNIIGRRGDVPPSSDSAPLDAINAVGDGFNVPEASTEKSFWQDFRGTAGVIERGM